MYAVQAVSSASSGDMSSPVSVTYDSMAPALGGASALRTPDGSICGRLARRGRSLARVRHRELRREARGDSAPATRRRGRPSARCSRRPPAVSDAATKNGTLYGYSVFAVDGAGNAVRQEASAKASDTLAPDPVTGIRALASSPTAVRLTWDVPPLKGDDADLDGYRVLQLRPGAKAPLNPQDGTILCKDVNLDTRDL